MFVQAHTTATTTEGLGYEKAFTNLLIGIVQESEGQLVYNADVKTKLEADGKVKLPDVTELVRMGVGGHLVVKSQKGNGHGLNDAVIKATAFEAQERFTGSLDPAKKV